MSSRFVIGEIAIIATPFGQHSWKDIPLDVKRQYWHALANGSAGKDELADIVEWSRKTWEAA